MLLLLLPAHARAHGTDAAIGTGTQEKSGCGTGRMGIIPLVLR